ncbi:MAG: hypothetical protein K0R65_2673 [Crocinitomicaceae bacterium]|jgi:uncharacterized membrane protein|nr:hypothetical protein [Crocinitomicaceae bacterium]
MDNPENTEIDRLKALLKELEVKNSAMYQEIQSLKIQIDRVAQNRAEIKSPGGQPVADQQPEVIPVPVQAAPVQVQKEAVPLQPQAKVSQPQKKKDWERFVGENLINKIGILITVIGVGIGTKYAIDHQLLSPVMRIMLGYLLGGGLLFFALRLKKNYLDFSAVLLSGSLAIFYFLTYISFSFYHFFPLQLTFLLMVLFTVGTVFAAVKYDRQIIAHLGFVGAYGIPFLLSDGSGKILFFFSYVAIINIGILAVSYFKNWKSLIYSAFGLTWAIFFAWYASAYKAEIHFSAALFFLSLFFLVFYAIGLVYKVKKHEKFHASDMVVLIANSFIFSGLGFSLIGTYTDGSETKLALFSVINALVHLVVALLLCRDKLADRAIYYFSCAMALLFITLTVPLLLDGNAVTLTWTLEFLVLFLFGRTRKISLFEEMSYPVLLLAFLNLVLFWGRTYGGLDLFSAVQDWRKAEITADNSFLLNYRFLTSFCFIAALGIAYYVNGIKKHLETTEGSSVASYDVNPDLLQFFRVLLVILLIVVPFSGISLEIHQYWDIKIITLQKDKNVLFYNISDIVHAFEALSKIAFSLLFTGVILFVRRTKQNSSEFNVFAVITCGFVLLVFLTLGLYWLSFLQLQHLYKTETYYAPSSLVLIRYAMYALVAAYVYTYFTFMKKQFTDRFFRIFSEYFLHVVIIWILSAELVNWMYVFNSKQAYKLWLSILWGVYSLFLIVIGIRDKKAYLRIGAISLFGVTLVKLFLYDLDRLSTLGKTVLFIILGVILLVISFLYNKYKNILFDEEEKESKM